MGDTIQPSATHPTISHSGMPFYLSFFLPFFLFSFYGCTCGIWKFPGKGRIRATVETYATATAMPDPSHISDLYHSLWQHQTLNPLSKARDQTRILHRLCQILNLLSHNGNSTFLHFKLQMSNLSADIPFLPPDLLLPQPSPSQYTDASSFQSRWPKPSGSSLIPVSFTPHI